MPNIVFLGPPGSGKGTRASRIAPKLGIPHIAVGQIFRDAISNKTPMGEKAKEYINEGKQVPNEISVGIILERLSQPDCKNGFILDSPYDKDQAEEIDKHKKIDVAVYVNVPEKILIRRLSSRMVCSKCGAIYNIRTLKPKIEGICDKCGGRLYQRDDDKPEAVEKRIHVYKERITPLLEYYKNRGILIEAGFTVDEIPEGLEDMPADEMAEKTLQKIKDFLKE
ncbi:MAG: nucleoside monophosphate kinase [Candidatus Aenigmarchaeota archaeon]|nr:nucleoside monophosphate kinase [Candidatus Aenigmarchaeota archaeon]